MNPASFWCLSQESDLQRPEARRPPCVQNPPSSTLSLSFSRYCRWIIVSHGDATERRAMRVMVNLPTWLVRERAQKRTPPFSDSDTILVVKSNKLCLPTWLVMLVKERAQNGCLHFPIPTPSNRTSCECGALIPNPDSFQMQS